MKKDATPTDVVMKKPSLGMLELVRVAIIWQQCALQKLTRMEI